MDDEKIAKNIKILLGDSDNKICFDCSQKNPNYINVTIGSFVCTSCAGKLRNYNFRVKALGLCTFSQAEYDLILKRGNEACHYIYTNSAQNPPPNNVERSMDDKYKNRLWYREMPPSIEKQILEKNKLLIDSSREGFGQKSNGQSKLSKNSTAGLIIATKSNDSLVPKVVNKPTVLPNTPSLFKTQQNTPITFNFNEFKVQPTFIAKEKAFAPISASLSCLPEPAPKNPFKSENKSSLNLFEQSQLTADRYAALAELDSNFKTDTTKNIGSSGYQSNQSSLQNEFSFGNPFLSTNNAAKPNNNKDLDLPTQIIDFDPFAEFKKGPSSSIATAEKKVESNVFDFNPFESFNFTTKQDSSSSKIDSFDPFGTEMATFSQQDKKIDPFANL